MVRNWNVSRRNILRVANVGICSRIEIADFDEAVRLDFSITITGV